MVVNKGSAPVDDECPLAEKCRVHEASKTIWDCMLNQACVFFLNHFVLLLRIAVIVDVVCAGLILRQTDTEKQDKIR